MSMQGDAAIEGVIKTLCKKLEAELNNSPKGLLYKDGIKYAGRQALTLFDWETPKWAAEYGRLFRA
jgi:hypothetical protein